MRTEDGHIIYKCLNGDSAAFGLLVDKYKESVYALACSKLHNFHDAEDVAQEVFIRAYQKLRTLRRYDSFLAWLYSITSNQCKMLIRERARRPDHEFIEDQDLETLEEPSKDSYRQEIMRESVHEALDSLPEIYRQALILHYLAGMTSTEIARFVGASPAAVRMRLSKARSLLKEEMLAMMSTTFEGQRLQAGFTFRIVEAVKKMKIQPMPRTAGLPWCLSLATGIVLAILRFSPYPGIPDRSVTGSPLPGETKVLKIGEIPVDILNVSRISTLASVRGDGNSVEPELPHPQTTVAANSDTLAQETTSGKEVVVDPETFVEYTKVKTLVGVNDVIRDTGGLDLSPNGKFLLWEVQVVPLNDSEPFDLVDMPGAVRGSWSPDGEKVAFYSQTGIWVIPVSPETGRPTGSAKKLFDGGHGSHLIVSWSPDSERVVFERDDEKSQGHIWTLSVTDGSLTQITDDPIREWRPVWSPDGKNIAYNRGYELRVVSAEGGTPRVIAREQDRPRPVSWSPDGEWVAYTARKKLRFFRLADGSESEIKPPWHEIGNFLSWSPDGKKMLFYRSSYEYKSCLKVVSVFGGQSSEPGKQLSLWVGDYQFWSPDSRMIVTEGESLDGDWVFWIIPLAGDPFPLELDVSVPGEPDPLSLSPDGGKLLFSVGRGDGTEDLWLVPVSLKDGSAASSAVKVFSGRYRKRAYTQTCSWSPDGAKLAITNDADFWIASAEGGEPIQLKTGKHPGHRVEPKWSPDGRMIAYRAYHSEEEQALRVISVSGSEATMILDVPEGIPAKHYAWSPDSKELTVYSNGVISAVPIAGGVRRQLLDLKDLGADNSWGLCWSPDGRNLAFVATNTEAALTTYYRGEGGKEQKIFIFSAENGKVTELAAGDPGDKWYLYWSPDGRWISYNSEGFAKTRPEAAIWEADVSELLSSQETEQ